MLQSTLPRFEQSPFLLFDIESLQDLVCHVELPGKVQLQADLLLPPHLRNQGGQLGHS